MLQQLLIQNYAIIDRLQVELPGNMNVITGETGAGKSIIMGALGLVLGERADPAVLMNKETKCIVEATFHAGTRKDIKRFLDDHDFDPSHEIVLRREIGINGKSRAFINDTPVTLQQLGALGSLLVDLHQQFDTLELGDAGFQRDVLDALAGQFALLEEYRALYRSWIAAKKELAELQQQKLQFDKEADYNQFQFDELSSASFRENELENIQQELLTLEHAGSIADTLTKAGYILQESETPVVQQVKQLINQLSPVAAYHASLPSILERLQSLHVELQDISHEIERAGSHVQFDPAKADQLNERISLGYRLQKKHGVHSTAELLEIQAQLEEKLKAVMHMDEAIASGERITATLGTQVEKIAARISEGRKKQVKSFEQKVNTLLAQVGMPNARLKVSIEASEPGPAGSDQVDFLFDANKSGQFQPVRKVASGGELSRLMLCIKSLVAKSIDLPTLIFDEIDTGISGEAARQVGLIMKELALNRQVICITHQPQIAGKADAHFFVFKEIVKDRVTTGLRKLTTEERITTIAQMLSGEKPTAAAIQNAREMVMN